MVPSMILNVVWGNYLIVDISTKYKVKIIWLQNFNLTHMEASFLKKILVWYIYIYIYIKLFHINLVASFSKLEHCRLYFLFFTFFIYLLTPSAFSTFEHCRLFIFYVLYLFFYYILFTWWRRLRSPRWQWTWSRPGPCSKPLRPRLLLHCPLSISGNNFINTLLFHTVQNVYHFWVIHSCVFLVS